MRNDARHFPLTDLLKANEALISFAELKTIFSTSSVSHSPDFPQTFFIHCDASKTGLGGVLVQRSWRVTDSIMSGKLNPAQRFYRVTEQEF